MKKYVLICCREREIFVLGVYDTIEMAQLAMDADVKLTLNDIYDEYDDDDDCGIDNYSAWYNGKDNIDWKIEEIQIKAMAKGNLKDLIKVLDAKATISLWQDETTLLFTGKVFELYNNDNFDKSIIGSLFVDFMSGTSVIIKEGLL